MDFSRWLLLLIAMLSVSCEQHPLAQDRQDPTPAPNRTYTDADERVARILALEKFATEKPKEPSAWTGAALTALATIVGGIVSSLFAYFIANRNADANAKLALTEARLGYAEQVLNLRLRQLEEFVAPLRALLKQSEGVTRKLHLQLVKEPEKYRWADPVKQQGLRLILDGKEHDFRLLDRLPELRNHKDVKLLVAEIIRIGSQITKLISQKAGLAQAQMRGNPTPDEMLCEVLGKYLAHYAILKGIFDDKNRIEPYPPGTHEIGYYPRELNKLVEEEYQRVLLELRPYFDTSAAVIRELN